MDTETAKAVFFSSQAVNNKHFYSNFSISRVVNVAVLVLLM